MAEKLIIIEGPSGSGKSLIVSEVQIRRRRLGQKTFAARLMPSQKPIENTTLIDKRAIKELLGVNLNFEESSHYPVSRLEITAGKLLSCETLLFKAALALRDESGADVLGIRSAISQTAIYQLAGEAASERGEEGDEERAKWAKEAAEKTKQALLNDKFLGKIDGIIHLERRVRSAPTTGRTGMAGLEDREGEHIASVIDWIQTRRSIPVLKVDVNSHIDNNTRGKEITKTMEFINSL